MKKNILSITILLLLTFSLNAKSKQSTENIYQLKVKSIEGKDVSLKSYKGKVILIVNTASKCGFTSQYKGLEELYVKYKDKGLVILGFPCNQFGGQEPGTSEEIMNFCSTKYGVTFPMFAKVDVNGDNAIPLYKFLKSQLPGTLGSEIKWNFTKFLVNKNGKPVERFGSTTKPENITEAIEKLLAE